jgi:Ca-activated chloride channel family protein
MRTRSLFILAMLLIASLFLPGHASADGIIIPTPPDCIRPPCPPRPIPMQQLDIRYHHVTVTINDQIAVTHVDQVFYNPNDWTIEGTYVFPLPAGAVVSNFTLWVDGKPVKGEVLSASQARSTYEDIVRSLRDPALLEYADRGAVRASIFPIPPQGERRIELEYTQALSAENGLVSYLYPLNTEKFSAKPLESVSVSVDVTSSQPIRAAYSPSHSISVDRIDANHVKASYEASNVIPDTDFAFYYSLGQSEAFHLLTFRDPADPQDPDGFFLLLLAPRPETPAGAVDKDVILVLDRSGSMDGEKFRQVQAAARFVLQHLNPGDRFNLITFSSVVTAFKPEIQGADAVPDALTWLDQQSAAGSTDINQALLTAAGMASSSRPTYLIFLTDGLPTEGVQDRQQILDNFTKNAPADLRLFPFGVGYDVDTILLDTLAQEHHGATTYVKPGQALDEVLSGFYARISAPVLTNLKLDFGALSVYDLYPNPLPDLFLGSQILVAGRYRAGGQATVTLSGQANGVEQTFTYPEQAFDQDTADKNGPLSALPRLWATRKIGALLTQIRLQGTNKETVDQIVKLSIRYGIVTPYTSYLVTEPDAVGAQAQQRIADEAYNQLAAQATAPASGQAAVEKSAGMGGMANAEAPAPSAPEDAAQVRVVGARTFVLNQGVWTDTAFDPQTMSTVKVPFLSKAYFDLAQSRPELAAALALGEKVIVMAGSTACEVVDASTPAAAIPLPPTYTPTPKGTPIAQVPTASPTRLPTSVPQHTATGATPTTPTNSTGAGTASICPGIILILVLMAVSVLAKRG